MKTGKTYQGIWQVGGREKHRERIRGEREIALVRRGKGVGWFWLLVKSTPENFRDTNQWNNKISENHQSSFGGFQKFLVESGSLTFARITLDFAINMIEFYRINPQVSSTRHLSPDAWNGSQDCSVHSLLRGCNPVRPSRPCWPGHNVIKLFTVVICEFS